MAKSEGQLRFEHGIAEIEQRIACGYYSEKTGFLHDYKALRDACGPLMTDEEIDALRRLALNSHHIGATILAEHGKPVPGNDPKKPN